MDGSYKLQILKKEYSLFSMFLPATSYGVLALLLFRIQIIVIKICTRK
jgi:hypothetical protein